MQPLSQRVCAWLSSLPSLGMREVSCGATSRQCRRNQGTALPTPINAVASDQPVGNLHDLDEIYLIAIWYLPRIFPDQQPAAVGQPISRAVPSHQLIWSPASSLFKKPAQLRVAAEHTVGLVIKDRLDKRALQHCVFVIQRKQPFGIDGLCALVPFPIDARAIGQEAFGPSLALRPTHPVSFPSALCDEFHACDGDRSNA